MEKVNKKQMPSPEQRPDIYDDFDYSDRPDGQPTGVKTPDYIKDLIDARSAKQSAKDGKED